MWSPPLNRMGGFLGCVKQRKYDCEITEPIAHRFTKGLCYFCGKVRAQRDKSNSSKEDLRRLRVFWERAAKINLGRHTARSPLTTKGTI